MNGSGPPVRLFRQPDAQHRAGGGLLCSRSQRSRVDDGGGAPYDEVARINGLLHLACLAHARRNFVEAEAVLPEGKRYATQPSARFIILIGELFAIEARAKDINEVERHDMRQQQSQPVMARIEALLIENLHAVLPQSRPRAFICDCAKRYYLRR